MNSDNAVIFVLILVGLACLTIWVVGKLQERSLAREKARREAENEELDRQTRQVRDDARRHREMVLAGTRGAQPKGRPTPAERLAAAIEHDTQQRRRYSDNPPPDVHQQNVFVMQAYANHDSGHSHSHSHGNSYSGCSSSSDSSSSSSDSGGSCGGGD